MKYKSNANYREPVESGTIFKMKHGKVDICVHYLCGIDGLYMNSCFLNIQDRRLKSNSVMSAIKEAQSIVKDCLDIICKDFDEVLNSDIEIEI